MSSSIDTYYSRAEKWDHTFASSPSDILGPQSLEMCSRPYCKDKQSINRQGDGSRCYLVVGWLCFFEEGRRQEGGLPCLHVEVSGQKVERLQVVSK